MINAISDLQSQASKFSYPFMMMLASEDHIISNKDALDWYNRTPQIENLQKERVMFQGLEHMLNKEKDNGQVFK